MYKHDKCNKKVANESLKFIEMYRNKKENSIYDDFYHSHLDCFEGLIEDWKKQEEDCYAVIICNKGTEYEDGVFLPNYATVCVKPHWGSEGIMLTSSFYDATKFDLSCEDLFPVYNYIKSRFPDKDFKVVYIDKGVFGNKPRELWSSKEVRGNFDKTGEISGTLIKEV